MSYIGRGIDQIDNISTLDNLSFNGSDATFNLTQNSVAFVPVSADALQIQIDGVIQSGNYTVSGSTVTFDFTPSGSSVCNGIRHFGVGLLTTVSDGAVTTAKINDGAVTSGKIASGVIPSTRPNVSPIIINGDMAISQRSASVTGITTNGITTIDRMYNGVTSIGTYTVAQESQTSGNAFANGFSNAYRLDCTTADASPSASDYLRLQYNIEGQDLQVFKKGTANAEKFTLAFWVKSNKTGTGNIQLKDKDNSNRQCTQSYTISSADTWEHKVCVFGADTTGAFDNDNGKSLIINWFLGSGTDWSSGTANHGTWEAQDDTKVNAGGTLNINDNTANDWSITGIQLEVGEYTSSTLPPFQHESFGDNLARCQRYFVKIETGGSSSLEMAVNKANPNNYNQSRGVYCLAVPMRSGASTTLSGTVKAGYLGGDFSLSDQGFSTVAPTYGSTTDRVNIVSTFMNQSSNNSQHSMMFVLQASSSLSLDAEL